MTTATDGDLVRQARAGDAAAYGHLARRWAARVLAVCHARTASADAAEDLAQEALLRGLRALPTLADPDKFGPWLVGIAVRTCFDWLKSPRRSEVSLDALAAGWSQAGDDDLRPFDPQGAEDDDAARDARDRAERLTREVERLPQAYREVLMLYYYQSAGCTYRELAELLGVSPATVNARLTKARQMLRERMMAEREE
jgi:RNA polymerase sigma-70 factor, ECF subfamily